MRDPYLDLPPIQPEAAYLPGKVVFTLRMQNILDHIIPLANDYLGVVKGEVVGAEVDITEQGDFVVTLSKNDRGSSRETL